MKRERKEGKQERQRQKKWEGIERRNKEEHSMLPGQTGFEPSFLVLFTMLSYASIKLVYAILAILKIRN